MYLIAFCMFIISVIRSALAIFLLYVPFYLFFCAYRCLCLCLGDTVLTPMAIFEGWLCHTASAFTHAHTYNSAIKTVYRATNKTGPQISISQHILPQTTQKCFNYTNKLFAQSRMARHWNSRTMELDYRWQEITVPICVCMCALCACGRNVLRSRGDGLQRSGEREIASDVTQCRACQNKSSHRTKQRETSYPRDSNNSFDLSSFSRKIPSFPFLNW